jgi:hypothetical protein
MPSFVARGLIGFGFSAATQKNGVRAHRSVSVRPFRMTRKETHLFDLDFPVMRPDPVAADGGRIGAPLLLGLETRGIDDVE